MALTKVRKRMSLRTVNNFTENQTLTDSHDLVTGDSTAGAFTFTLPTASGIAGRHYTFIKTDSSANGITIDANASETINGATTYVLGTQYESITIVSDGSNWYVV